MMGRIFVVVAVALSASACSDPIAKAVNEAFPPIDRTRSALLTLQDSEAGLRDVGDANVSAFLSKKDIEPPLKLLLEGVKELSSAKIEFAEQRILADTNFQTTFKDLNVEVAGHATPPLQSPCPLWPRHLQHPLPIHHSTHRSKHFETGFKRHKSVPSFTPKSSTAPMSPYKSL